MLAKVILPSEMTEYFDLVKVRTDEYAQEQRLHLYLDEKDIAPEGHVRAFRLNFGGDATEIETVSHEPLTNNQTFDLTGRRIDGVPTAKGVYIVGGRKVVVK